MKFETESNNNFWRSCKKIFLERLHGQEIQGNPYWLLDEVNLMNFVELFCSLFKKV